MADVDVRQLRFVTAIAATGSISEASRRLFVTQPALTRHVAAVERATGLRLFERKTTGVALTADGQRFLVGAQRVLAEYDRLVPQRDGGMKLYDPVHGDDGRVGDEQARRMAPRAVMRLGVEVDAPREATELIGSFARTRPGASWTVLRAYETDLWTMLDDGLIDAAVLWLPPPSAALAAADVRSIQYLVALPDSLAGRYAGPVPRHVFADFPVALWGREVDPLAYDYWTALIAEGLSAVTYRAVPSHDNAQHQMLLEVAKGAAVTVVTESHWRAAPCAGVQARRLDPPLAAPLRLAWRRAHPNAWIADLVSAFEP